MYPAPFVSQEFQGVSETALSGGKVNVRLDQFQNGNLQSITFMLERLTLGDVIQTRIASCMNNEILYEPMSNIEIRYGGQTINRTDDHSDQLMQLSETWIDNSMAIQGGVPGMSSVVTANNQVVVTPYLISWYRYQIVQFSQSYFSNCVQDGVDVIKIFSSIGKRVLNFFRIAPKSDQ